MPSTVKQRNKSDLKYQQTDLPKTVTNILHIITIIIEEKFISLSTSAVSFDGIY